MSRMKERGEAMRLFLESGGRASHAEIAEKLNVKPERVRQWKCLDKWEEALKKQPRKRGGQPGNRNSVGHGAPLRNHNAVTHGAYASVRFEDMTEEDRELIESVTLNVAENMLRELRELVAKEADLKKRIRQLYQETGSLFLDRVVQVKKKGGAEADGEQEENNPGNAEEGDDEAGEGLKTFMETAIMSSAFEWEMKLRSELDKTQSRIIKLIDTIKSYEMEQWRMDLEERRHKIYKQKVSGKYDIDEETGEINDDYMQGTKGEP